MKTYTLTFLPEGKRLTISEDTLLADALVDAGIPLPCHAAGKGSAGMQG